MTPSRHAHGLLHYLGLLFAFQCRLCRSSTRPGMICNIASGNRIALHSEGSGSALVELRLSELLVTSSRKPHPKVNFGGKP